MTDAELVLRARGGDSAATARLFERYRGMVRFRAKSYFLQGGESDDLIQEGLLGLYKAIRDYRSDRESSFRSFAELCITRQIITDGLLQRWQREIEKAFSSTPGGARR